MKILSVCSSWRVFGAETVTLKMLEGFRRNSHEQLAVTTIWTDGQFSQRLGEIGIAEKRMAFGAIVASLSPRYIKWTADVLIRLPALWSTWRRVIRTFEPDVILFTSSKQTLHLLPFLSNQPPWFLIEYTNVAPTKNMRWLYRQLTKRSCRFIAVSDFMRDHLHSLGAPLEKIHVIRSGVFFRDELERIKQAAPVRSPEHVGTRIGIAGQIAPNKGHDCLVEAIRSLAAEQLPFSVEVFGDGAVSYRKQLEAKITRLGLEHLWHWHSYERRKDRIFSAFDICVVPSCFGDPFPTVAMEASAYGLPVIASRIGGLPEIVEDGVTGWLVPPNEPEQLANRIRQLVKSTKDSTRMGAAGQNRIRENFTVEQMVSEFEGLFTETIGQRA